MVKNKAIKLPLIILGILMVSATGLAIEREVSKKEVLYNTAKEVSKKVSQNTPSEYISISELWSDFCHLTPPYTTPHLQCDGKTVKVYGYIDYQNVFDKNHYPKLPYEKFTIYENYDRTGQSIEVWPVSDNNVAIFRNIYDNESFPKKKALLKGIIEVFTMPSMGTSRDGIKIVMDKTDDIFFQY